MKAVPKVYDIVSFSEGFLEGWGAIQDDLSPYHRARVQDAGILKTKAFEEYILGYQLGSLNHFFSERYLYVCVGIIVMVYLLTRNDRHGSVTIV